MTTTRPRLRLVFRFLDLGALDSTQHGVTQVRVETYNSSIGVLENLAWLQGPYANVSTIVTPEGSDCVRLSVRQLTNASEPHSHVGFELEFSGLASGVVSPQPSPPSTCVAALDVNEGIVPWDISDTNAFDAAPSIFGTLTANNCTNTSGALYFKYTPSASGKVYISTCRLTYADTVLSAFSSCDVATTSLLACDDDCHPDGGAGSTLHLTVTNGVPILLRLALWTKSADSPRSPVGAGLLNISWQSPQAPRTPTGSLAAALANPTQPLIVPMQANYSSVEVLQRWSEFPAGPVYAMFDDPSVRVGPTSPHVPPLFSVAVERNASTPPYSPLTAGRLLVLQSGRGVFALTAERQQFTRSLGFCVASAWATTQLSPPVRMWTTYATIVTWDEASCTDSPLIKVQRARALAIDC